MPKTMGEIKMYNLRLYIKFIKHKILKIPLKIMTLSDDYNSKMLDPIIKYPHKYYQLTTPNNKKVIAIFHNLKKLRMRKRYCNFLLYNYIYYWTFISYENAPIIYNCNFKEFKQYYSSFFFPHLLSENNILSDLVMDKMVPKEDDVNTIYMIRLKSYM